MVKFYYTIWGRELFNITKKTILGLLIAGNICLCGYPADFNLPFFHKKNQVESPSNTKIQEAEESFWEQDFEDIDDNVPEINKDTNFIKSGTVMADETLAEQNSKEIRSVQIVGTNVISPESILPKLKTKAGEKFDKNVMQDDLKTIYAMGDFTARMKAVPTDNPDGTIDIEIVVEENIPVTDFQIYGNEVVSKEEILSVFYPLIGKPQNINKFNEAIEQINACYASKGYILAKINSIYDDPDGTINIEFDEGINLITGYNTNTSKSNGSR